MKQRLEGLKKYDLFGHAVSDRDQRGDRQADYSPAPIGRIAFDREVAARQPQQADQDE